MLGRPGTELCGPGITRSCAGTRGRLATQNRGTTSPRLPRAARARAPCRRLGAALGVRSPSGSPRGSAGAAAAAGCGLRAAEASGPVSRGRASCGVLAPRPCRLCRVRVQVRGADPGSGRGVRVRGAGLPLTGAASCPPSPGGGTRVAGGAAGGRPPSRAEVVRRARQRPVLRPRARTCGPLARSRRPRWSCPGCCVAGPAWPVGSGLCGAVGAVALGEGAARRTWSPGAVWMPGGPGCAAGQERRGDASSLRILGAQ